VEKKIYTYARTTASRITFFIFIFRGSFYVSLENKRLLSDDGDYVVTCLFIHYTYVYDSILYIFFPRVRVARRIVCIYIYARTRRNIIYINIHVRWGEPGVLYIIYVTQRANVTHKKHRKKKTKRKT